MKLIYYTLLCIVIGIGSSHAQILFDLCEQSVFTRIELSKQEQQASSTITNVGSEKTDIVLKIEDWLVPKDWQIYIQYKQIQKKINPSRFEETISLNPGEKIDLKVNIQTNGNEGEGLLSFRIYEKSNRLESQVGTIIFGKTDPYIISNAVHISIYPNPTTDFFYAISNRKIKKIEVYNILGTLQRTFLVSPQITYSIADLPKGIYLIKFITPDNTVIKTSRLQKQ